MTRGWLVTGLVLVMCCLQHAEGTCPLVKAPSTVPIPNDVCLDVELCHNQKIRFEARRCTAADRITIWFYMADAQYVNPQFDMRFGFGGRYLYQANNRGANGWGKELIFPKKMELVAGQDFILDFNIHGDSMIEWTIDGQFIGLYAMRDNAKVQDIKRLCINRCIVVDKLQFNTVIL